MKRFAQRFLQTMAIGLGGLLAFLAYTFSPKPLDTAITGTESEWGSYHQLKKTPSSEAPIRLSVIDTGYSRSPEAFAFRGGRWLRTYQFGFIAVLVRHPRANVLIDAGLGRGVDEEFAGNSLWDRMLLKYEKAKPAIDQLEERGVPPEEIQGIILTHAHWDHASGLRDFPHAKIYAPRAEFDFVARATRPVIIREQFTVPPANRNFIDFTGGAYENFERSLDLFADGRIVLVPLPGHTPGSTGVFINFESGRRFFFIGDLTWALEGLQLPAERPWLARRMVDVDPAEVRRSIMKVHRLMKRHPSLVVVPAHDQRAIKNIARFPEYEQ
ncbi:MAG: MBL fold metallo-hydrolase [Acidobacteria bacterium]|nr:MBL fold metallo-hydrolase [Acidobacteriota bacterium]